MRLASQERLHGRRVSVAVGAALALCVAFASVTLAQAPAEPRFDVASIRRNTSGTTQQSINAGPTGATFINVQAGGRTRRGPHRAAHGKLMAPGRPARPPL